MKPLTLASNKRRSGGRISAAFLCIVLLIIAGLYWQRQNVYDWFKLRGYTPPAPIAQLATDDEMTSYARHMYYVNHPLLRDKTTFSQYCSNGAEQTVVLGCYKSGEQGIYLLSVTTPELAGIEQVTAAHETLHAAYERLSTGERKRVNAMLLSYYGKHKNDASLKELIGSYQKSEPGRVVDEMHSIFGTQVSNLPNDLEQYYTKYFTDRAKIVDYYDQYESAFSGRLAQVADYDAQLSSWKVQIDQYESALAAKASALSAQRTTLNGYAASGDARQYNASLVGYNAAVDDYNAQLQQLKDLVDRYNQTVAKRNAIAFEEQSLVQDITSVPSKTISK